MNTTRGLRSAVEALRRQSGAEGPSSLSLILVLEDEGGGPPQEVYVGTLSGPSAPKRHQFSALTGLTEHGELPPGA